MISGSASCSSDISYTDEQLDEERCKWIPDIFSNDSTLLELRERALPFIGGYSFSNLVHTGSSISSTHFNRYVLLQLIYQHLSSAGLHMTAEAIEKETGLKFQDINQPWDKTGLSILASLGSLPHNNPWEIKPDENVQFFDEVFDEDMYAFHYREDPKLLFEELLDKEKNIVYTEGKSHLFGHIKAASLRRFVIILATQDSSYLSYEDFYYFFLSLPSITSSHHFFQHIVTLYELDFDDPVIVDKLERQMSGIRITILYLIKKWIKFHGLFIGKQTLNEIKTFLKKLINTSQGSAKYITYLESCITIIEKSTYGLYHETNRSIEFVPPLIKEPNFLMKKSLTILHPEPMEVARQISLLALKYFSNINSREIIEMLSTNKTSMRTPLVSSYLTFCQKLTDLAFETVITSLDFAVAFNRLLEIGSALISLNNFQCTYSLFRAFDNEENLILIQASSQQIDSFRQLIAKCGIRKLDYPIYWEEISNYYKEQLPAPVIPNISADLMNYEIEDKPDFVNGLINWDKKKKLVSKCLIYYYFQNCQYPFYEITQIEKLIERGPTLTNLEMQNKLDNLWRSKCAS